MANNCVNYGTTDYTTKVKLLGRIITETYSNTTNDHLVNLPDCITCNVHLKRFSIPLQCSVCARYKSMK